MPRVRREEGHWKDKLPQLIELRKQGLSYRKCGETLGIPTGTIANLCVKFKLQSRDLGVEPVVSRVSRPHPLRGQKKQDSGWTEAVLTEKWVDYSARMKAERKKKAEAQAMASCSSSDQSSHT